MKATPGRIVHYVPPEAVVPECQAAIVTGDSYGGEITLTVFLKDGIEILGQGVPQDETGKSGGTWHWPERVSG